MYLPSEQAVVIDPRGPRERAVSLQNTIIARWCALAILSLLLGASVSILGTSELNKSVHGLDPTIGKIAVAVVIASLIGMVVCIYKAFKAWSKKQAYL